jgi:hypothetical protein
MIAHPANLENLDWLLEKENPSVRYFTLRELCGAPADDPEVLHALAEIMRSGPVPKILSKQAEGGYWGRLEDFYERSKYKGTVWNLILLAELGADGDDFRVRKAAAFVLEHVQHPESGGFAYLGQPSGGGAPGCVIPCLTGNMLWSLVRLGWLDDPRIQGGLEWAADSLRCDDGGSRPPEAWPYTGRAGKERCWGRHSCTMGVVKTLKALAEVPPERRSPAMQSAIERGAEFLLAHRLYKRSHALDKVAKAEWMEFGFPLMYKTDALEMLEVLTRLGYQDSRMQDAVELVLSKQVDGPQGHPCWVLDKSFNGRMLVTIERQGEPSKWITLRALSALDNRW